MILFWFIICIMLILTVCLVIIPIETYKEKKIYLAIPIFISVVPLYFLLGSPQALQQWLVMQEDQKFYNNIIFDLNSKNINVAASLAQIKARLKENPDSILGWYFVGELLFKLEEYDAAAVAYDRAYRLDPNEELLEQIAKTREFAKKNKSF